MARNGSITTSTMVFRIALRIFMGNQLSEEA